MRGSIRLGWLTLVYCPTNEMTADIPSTKRKSAGSAGFNYIVAIVTCHQQCLFPFQLSTTSTTVASSHYNSRYIDSSKSNLFYIDYSSLLHLQQLVHDGQCSSSSPSSPSSPVVFAPSTDTLGTSTSLCRPVRMTFVITRRVCRVLRQSRWVRCCCCCVWRDRRGARTR